MNMRVAVKYCGGCNCSYDRVAMVRDLQRQFPDITIVSAESQDGIPADLVLVICGCSCVCASHDHLEGRHGKVVTACPGDFEAVRAVVEDFISQ